MIIKCRTHGERKNSPCIYWNGEECIASYGECNYQEAETEESIEQIDGIEDLIKGLDEINTAPKNNVQENKQMPTLIPMDILLRYLEPAYREGLLKYYRESWRIGFPVSVMIDAALRHIIEFFYEKNDFDPDAEKLGIVKHHLGGAIFSLLCVLQTLEKRPDLDDRFFPNTKDK